MSHPSDVAQRLAEIRGQVDSARAAGEPDTAFRTYDDALAAALAAAEQATQAQREAVGAYWKATDEIAHLMVEAERLRTAGAKVCEGFDKGIFVRALEWDAASDWAVKLLPYIQAIGVLAAAAQPPQGGTEET
jgi:hypothetical protein